MNGKSTKEFRQKHQREVVLRWFQAHPNYQREYRAKQERLRAELGTALNGTLPVKSQKKITYSVTVTRPLKPEERVQRDPLKRRNHNTHATQSNIPSTTEDYEW